MEEVEYREFDWSNGDHYKGYCLRGQYIPHGWGIKTTPTSTHEGNFKNGEGDGFGRISFHLNSQPFSLTQNRILSYEGGFREGYFHGEGTATYWIPAFAAISSGGHYHTYTGGWSWSEKSGYGEMTFFDGATYEGGWKNDLQNGNGVISWVKGYYSSYDGGWKDGKKEGFGVLISNDGTTYEGGWHDDVQQGHGISTVPYTYEVDN